MTTRFIADGQRRMTLELIKQFEAKKKQLEIQLSTASSPDDKAAIIKALHQLRAEHKEEVARLQTALF